MSATTSNNNNVYNESNNMQLLAGESLLGRVLSALLLLAVA